MADLLISEGYADVGYEYVNVDDCWLEKSRGSQNELVEDKKRFPNGMKSLGQYVRTFEYLMVRYLCMRSHRYFLYLTNQQ